MATPEQNKATIARLFNEFYGQKNMAVADEIFEPAAVLHDSRLGDVPFGPDQVRAGEQQQLAAVPDIAVSLLQVVAEGDFVAYHWQVGGTQNVQMGNMVQPRPFAAQAITMARFGPDGRIAEMWRVFDQLTMMSQLGQLGQFGAQMGQVQMPQQQETVIPVGKKGKWGFRVTRGGGGDDDWSTDDD